MLATSPKLAGKDYLNFKILKYNQLSRTFIDAIVIVLFDKCIVGECNK